MRSISLSSLALMPLLVACGSGDWTVTTWGEDFIELGIESAEFEDSCSASFDSFEVEFSSASLLTAEDEVAGEVSVGRFELTSPGPQELGSTTVAAGDYDRVYYEISSSTGDAVRTAGSLTCGGETVTFDWSFDVSSQFRCLSLGVTVGADEEVTTDLTIHGDHLFFDSLEDEGAVLRGQAIVDADADADGVVTMSELEAISLSDYGYKVGSYTELADLGSFITKLMELVGHVDGEGHCYVD